MKTAMKTAVGVIALAAIVLVVVVPLAMALLAVASERSGPSDSPQALPSSDLMAPAPTPYSPRLTGAEAAGKVEADLRAAVKKAHPEQPNAFILCDPEDFNVHTNTWIVRCILKGTRSVTVRLQVDDRTGVISPLE